MGGGSHTKLIFFGFSSLRSKKQAVRTGQPWQEASKGAQVPDLEISSFTVVG
jgi:hypothetical protein